MIVLASIIYKKKRRMCWFLPQRLNPKSLQQWSVHIWKTIFFTSLFLRIVTLELFTIHCVPLPFILCAQLFLTQSTSIQGLWISYQSRNHCRDTTITSLPYLVLNVLFSPFRRYMRRQMFRKLHGDQRLSINSFKSEKPIFVLLWDPAVDWHSPPFFSVMKCKRRIFVT